MKISCGHLHTGTAGTARELLVELEPEDPKDWTASIGTWFIDAPGQSVAWRHYLLSCVHLRPIEGVDKQAELLEEGVSHEFVLLALDPSKKPEPTNHNTWDPLHPFNLVQQVKVHDDSAAANLLNLCAAGVANGQLWAEPPLSGQVEPWKSFLQHYTKQWKNKAS